MAATLDVADHLMAAVVSVFGPRVSCAVTDPKAAQPELMATERPAVATAIPRRQQEFAAGRHAARLAMVKLGLEPAAIAAGNDRAPIWPQDVVGSISHCDKVGIAVVAHAKEMRSLGVDIETATALADDLISAICSDAEQSRIKGPDRGRLAKLIFSAKEATYKAQYPITGLLFGFDHLDIVLDEIAGTFVATFHKPAAPFEVGDTLPGRFVQVADVLVTGVIIGQDAPKGA